MWDEVGLGEIPFSAGLKGFGARPTLPSITLRQPFIRNSRLGQGLLKCYRCGSQGPRQMTAAMASFVPGGCIEVAQSECGAPPATGVGTTPPAGTGSWGNPNLPTGSFMDGPTEITVLVKEPTELKPYTQGADVVIQGFNIRNFNQQGVPNTVEIVRGKTDQNGKFVWSGNAPTPNNEYRYQVLISLPGQARPKTVQVPARLPAAAAAGNQMVSKSEIVVSVCPSNVDPIICAVADARLDVLAGQRQVMVIEPPGPYTMLKHPRLMAHWTVFRFWISDEGILPKDWPDLVNNYDQAWRIFTSIPFPKVPEAEDLWIRCARGIPLWDGLSIANPRLFVSDYFPRTDYQIEVDMAFQYLICIPATITCMIAKVEAKARELARRAKTFKILGIVSLVMLAPLAGGAMISVLGTEVGEIAYTLASDRPPSGAVSTLTTGGVALASSDPQALERLISSGVSLLMDKFGEDLNDVVKRIISAAVPKIVSAAMGDVVSGTTTVTAGAGSGAADFISLSSVGSAAAAMAVKLLANMITAQGVSGAKDFQKTVLGMQDLPTLTIPFVLWATTILAMDKLFEEAARLAALDQAASGITPEPAPGDTPIGDLDSEKDVVDPLLDDAISQGVEVPPIAIAKRDPIIGGPSTTVGSVAGIGGAALALLLVTGAIS